MTQVTYTVFNWRYIGTRFQTPLGGMIVKTNIGSIDRIVRILAGLGLIVWAFTGGPVWAWIGVVPLATGLLGLCLL